MTQETERPRKPSETSTVLTPRRPSHQNVIENLDRWANSSGLQPPKSTDAKSA